MQWMIYFKIHDDEYRTALLDYHEKYERWNLQIIPQELE